VFNHSLSDTATSVFDIIYSMLAIFWPQAPPPEGPHLQPARGDDDPFLLDPLLPLVLPIKRAHVEPVGIVVL